MIVTPGGRPLTADALVRLIFVVGVAGCLIAAGALAGLCALAVVVVLEWADTAPR
jgi:hypothetical protein